MVQSLKHKEPSFLVYGLGLSGESVINFFKKNGIKRETEILAKKYFLSARDSIKNIKLSNANELNNFVDLIEERTF